MENGLAALSIPLIVRRVLSHLAWRDLDSCRRVCSLWRAEAERLRVRRPARPFAVLRRRRGRVALEPEAPPPPRAPPSLAVSFWSREAAESRLRHEETWRETIGDDDDGRAPRAAVFAGEVYYEPRSVDGEREGTPLLSGFTLPKIDGLRVRILEFEPENDGAPAKALDEIAKTDRIKTALVFVCGCDESFQSGVLEKLEAIRSTNEFSIGGFVAHRTKFNDDEVKGEERVSVIIISHAKTSDLAYDSFSAIFDSELQKKSEVEDKMKDVAESISLLKHSLCLKFTCFKRGKAEKLEIDAFKKYFPSIPLVGCDAMGEIGSEYLGLNHCKSSKRLREEILFTGYSTIFVFLTWDDGTL